MKNYALITGASKGIGLELAKLFAKDGYSLVMVARSNDLLEKLKELDFITIYNANSKGPVVAFNIKGVFSQDTSVYLDKYNICIRAGNHCTKMLKDEINIKNTCRISLALYNNKEEIDLLINVLKNSENIWKEIL